MATAANAKVSYLTTDHLGSPRITTNKDGGVISRRDFMPFGEEISTSQRTTGLGYTADTVRKKFTGYERDQETDMDFAQARMYSSQLGRFTSPDPLLNTGRSDLPQTWNRFTYVMNNPLILVDPTGMYICTAGKTNCEKFEASLQEARNNLDKIKVEYGETSENYINAKAAVDVYGNKGEDNGVTIVLAGRDIPAEAGGKTETEGIRKKRTPLNREGKSIRVTLTQKTFDSKELTTSITHEGSHAAGGSEWVKCNFCESKNPTSYQIELKGYLVQATFSQALGLKSFYSYDPVQIKGTPRAFGLFQLWNPSWKSVDESKPQIDVFLRRSKLYKDDLTDKVFIKGARF